jgi:hypothetical protein
MHWSAIQYINIFIVPCIGLHSTKSIQLRCKLVEQGGGDIIGPDMEESGGSMYVCGQIVITSKS